MTKEMASKIAKEITHLRGLELYDISEGIWIRVLRAIPIKRIPPYKNYYVSIDLVPLEEDYTMNVSYDYFEKYVKINKPGIESGE